MHSQITLKSWISRRWEYFICWRKGACLSSGHSNFPKSPVAQWTFLSRNKPQLTNLQLTEVLVGSNCTADSGRSFPQLIIKAFHPTDDSVFLLQA